MVLPSVLHLGRGRLNLSFEGLMRRDRLVFDVCKLRQLALVLTLGGGYADPIDRTVQAHVNTIGCVNVF